MYGSWSAVEVTLTVAAYSLAWFVIGVLAGRRLPKQSQAARRSPPPKSTRKSQWVEIYVGNLSYDVSEKDLASIFEPFGRVHSVRLIQHKFSGKSKGFGFVEMNERSEAEAAISALSGSDMKGRKLVVNEARSQAR